MGSRKEYTQAIGCKVYSKVKETAFHQLRRTRLAPGQPTRPSGNSLSSGSLEGKFGRADLGETLLKTWHLLFGLASTLARSLQRRACSKCYALLLTNPGKNTNHMVAISPDTSLETSYVLSWFECAMYPIGSRSNACLFFLEVVASLEVKSGRRRPLGVSPEL